MKFLDVKVVTVNSVYKILKNRMSKSYFLNKHIGNTKSSKNGKK